MNDSKKQFVEQLLIADRPSPDVPAASSTSGSVPTTRISSPSAVTSGGAANHPCGTRAANQARTSSAIDYNITFWSLLLSPAYAAASSAFLPPGMNCSSSTTISVR